MSLLQSQLMVQLMAGCSDPGLYSAEAVAGARETLTWLPSGTACAPTVQQQAKPC